MLWMQQAVWKFLQFLRPFIAVGYGVYICTEPTAAYTLHENGARPRESQAVWAESASYLMRLEQRPGCLQAAQPRCE